MAAPCCGFPRENQSVCAAEGPVLFGIPRLKYSQAQRFPPDPALHSSSRCPKGPPPCPAVSLPPLTTPAASLPWALGRSGRKNAWHNVHSSVLCWEPPATLCAAAGPAPTSPCQSPSQRSRERSSSCACGRCLSAATGLHSSALAEPPEQLLEGVRSGSIPICWRDAGSEHSAEPLCQRSCASCGSCAGLRPELRISWAPAEQSRSLPGRC